MAKRKNNKRVRSKRVRSKRIRDKRIKRTKRNKRSSNKRMKRSFIKKSKSRSRRSLRRLRGGADPLGATINVTVSMMGRHGSKVYTMDSDKTIFDLKQKITAEIGIPTNLLRLLSGGVDMDDSKKIVHNATYGVSLKQL